MNIAQKDKTRIDFVVIGAQKSGTTALFNYLIQNKTIFMPKKKELHFFKRSIDHSGDLDYTKYHSHFDFTEKFQAFGEASPNYMYWPRAMQFIYKYNPHINLVVALRNPVIRAHSAWAMEVSRGREHLCFSQAIRTGRERVSAAPGGVHPIYSYVERGFYAQQIAKVFDYFPRQQVFFIKSDDISPGAAMTDLQRFLGVAPVELSLMSEHFEPGLGPFPPVMSEQDGAYLRAIYRQDIEQIPKLTGIDTADWLQADQSHKVVR